MAANANLLKKLEEINTILNSEECNLSEEKTQKIERFFNETIFLLKLSPREEFLSRNLIDVFPVKYLAKWLSYQHIVTVEDLINKKRSDILNIRNIGAKTMIPIDKWMEENSLVFKED